MSSNFVNKLVAIAFTLLTLWLALYADVEKSIEAFFKAHGFDGQKGIVSFIAGFCITLIASLAILIYEKLIWKHAFRRAYRGGWWLYALVDDEVDPTKPTERGAQPIVGFFRINHSMDGCKIANARCFYYDASNAANHVTTERGFWSASLVTLTDSDIRLVYEMPQAAAPPNGKNFLPRHYMGYMELRNHCSEQPPFFGDVPHRGLIVEVSLEHDHGGIIYCERLKSPFLMELSPKKLMEVLHLHSPNLVATALASRSAEQGVQLLTKR